MIRPQSMLGGRYRVGRRIGEGGMAVVFAGHDLLLGRDVAIKTLRPQFAADPVVRHRFSREARAAGSLSHPNIIDVYDVGADHDTPYIVMELIHGQSLKEIVAAEAPFAADDVAPLLAQIAAALDFAHARGYVHRDIKPANILIDELNRVRVLDFGIAKGLADADLTEADGGFGTAAYIAPEQAEGLMATPASDVYSLGVVAYELLTGEQPFAAETAVGLAMRHVNDPPPRPSSIVAAVPPDIDTVVLRALEKDPTRRWNSAGAFASAFSRWHEPKPPVSVKPSVPVPPEKSAAAASVTPFVAILVAIALAGLLWFGLRPNLAGDSPEPASVPIPQAPVITGGVDKSAGDLVPTIAPALPTRQVAEAPPAAAPPTIAPVVAGVTVPNLQGLTIAAATAALLPQGLRIALDQPVNSDTVPLNAIVRQDPSPGTDVSPGDMVRVSLSRGPARGLGGQP